VRKQRQGLLDHEEQAAHVRIECLIEVSFRDFAQLSKFVESCVNEQDVDAAGLLPYGFVDPIYIRQDGRSPRTAVRLLRISATALSSSD
jgi:hypothetical protein